jgi:hypothetical protein
MRDIRASVEVRAFIGAEKLRELHGDTFAQYECWQCDGSGRTTEPTSVVVLGYRVFRVAKFAHAACAESQIVEVDAAAMRTAASQLPCRATAGGLQEPTGGGFAAVRTAPVRGCPA